MNKNIISTILSFFVVCVIYAQNTEDTSKKFDSIYFHVVANLSGQNIDRAFQVADSLYQTSDSKLHKVKSLMLLSSLYQDKGELEEALIWAERAEKIASKEKIYDWQARISGFLSTSYRNIGLYERGKIHLDKGLKVGNRIENKTHRNIYMGMVYQEKAYYNLAEDNLAEAEQSMIRSDGYFQIVPNSPQKNYFLAGAENLLGEIYFSKKKYDDALEHYQKALDLLGDVVEENTLLKGYVFEGMGKTYLVKENFEKVVEYLNKAESIAESSANITLKLDVYDTFSKYYKEIDDYKNHSLYRDKFVETQNSYNINRRKTIDNVVKALEEDKNILYSIQNRYLVGIVVLSVFGISLFVFFQWKKKKDIEKFNKIIRELSKDIEAIQSSNNPIEKSDKDDDHKKSINISEHKEQEILESLKEFEKTEKFLDKGFSLSALAEILNTNSVYASHVLNNCYNKDFNTYINELRIRYIARKLKENKDYRHYKISYLAEECGFSTHSKFSSVFKDVTGLTPSFFISHLDKD